MIQLYVIVYQYLDSEETKLKYRLAQLDDLRVKTIEDLQEIVYTKVKLQYLQKIGSDLLQLMKDY